MAEILHFPTTSLTAELTHTTSSDAAARAAALDTRSSSIVEAPAGSGKTGLLVQRFLKLLADPDIAQPEEVLAMTFTRKATAEMQQRVLEHLQAAHARTPLPADASPFDSETRALAEAVLARSAQLGWNLLAQPQRLNIRSILSVCLEIANSLPLLSGGGPRKPLDDAGPLYRLAARRTLLQLGGADSALHNALRTVLLHRDGSLANVETLLADMLDTRDQWGELIPLAPAALDDATLDREVRPKLERALEAILCAGLTRALQAMPPSTLHELATLAARLGLAPGLNGAASPIALCAQKPDPPEAVAEHLDHWRALIHLLLKPSDHDWRAGYARNHLGFEIPKADAARLKELVQEIQSEPLREALHAVRNLPPAHYPDEQWAVARALFHVLRHALVELKLLFSERNQCDYTELALAARQALRSSAATSDSAPENTYSLPDLALSPGGRLRHLLVDEMQDTSAIQYDLIRLLTASWDGHSQTLFLVGDPKQSIYLFRHATVANFLRTLHEGRLGDIPLTPLRLTANFRSQATLVEAFNHTFGGNHPAGRIFPPPAANLRPELPRPPEWPSDAVERPASTPTHELSDVPFVAAIPTRPATHPHALHWHAAVLGEDPAEPTFAAADAAADYAASEARHIRRLIEQRLALPLPPERSHPDNPKPWSIAILARARNHLAAILQELKAHDGLPAIPFRAVDLDPLEELPEVLDALALTRALLHSADRIAWLAVLHAPWCGLGLADLLALTGEASDTDPHATVAALVHGRRQHLSPLGRRLLDRAWPILETAVATLGRTSLSVQVERTWRSLGGDAPLTPDQHANVLRFLRVLSEVEAEPSLDLLNALTTRLKKLYAEPQAANTQAAEATQAQVPQSPIQVEIMTIHKAKGLEWDVVFLPGLHRPTRPDTSDLLNWAEIDAPPTPTGDHQATLILAPIPGKGSDSDHLNQWLHSLHARRERAEEKRLFYVASTRAREQLHLFAALSRKQDGSLASPRHGTLLKACWPAAESHFAELAASPQTLSTEPPDTSFIAQPEPELPGAPVIAQLYRAMGGVDDNLEPFELDIAASANGHQVPPAPTPTPPTLQRLPLSFDPSARFAAADAHRLPYTPAASLTPTPSFARPEGSFVVRAFGNVVHRYLQVIATRLAASTAPNPPVTETLAPNPPARDPLAELLAELPSWEPRLTASLRGEGLPPAAAAREAARALRALTRTLDDPTGRWLLSPHPLAASEQSLSSLRTSNAAASSLRIDRTFLAGSTPLSVVPASGESACLWIIDFKTTDPGSRSPEAFAAAEIAKYATQLQSYANLLQTYNASLLQSYAAALPHPLSGRDLPIRLGLFYPLIPRLLDWPFSPAGAASPASTPPLP